MWLNREHVELFLISKWNSSGIAEVLWYTYTFDVVLFIFQSNFSSISKHSYADNIGETHTVLYIFGHL